MSVGEVEGRDCTGYLFIFPLGDAELESAMDDALKSSGSDALTDVVVVSRGWTAILYARRCVIVTGEGWRWPGLAADTLQGDRPPQTAP